MRFDVDATFGDDYLHFYLPMLTDERNDADVEDVVRFLDLREGEAVLDAPCGHGRISHRLAARGVRVTGVDSSRTFLDVAQAAVAADPVDVRYVEGDLRRLPVDGPFDAALSWFTSFGYFDDVGNRGVLAEYRRVLRPGGRLLIETLHRDDFVRRFTPAPASVVTHVGDDLMVDTTEFDSLEGRVETERIVVREGVTRRSHHSIRVPAITELRVWLHDAGFSSARFTARDGGVPSIHRPRLVVVATA